MRPLEVVLFDLDGTLVDHAGALRAAVVGWLTSERLATPEDCDGGLVERWNEVAERHFPAFRSGVVSFQEQRRRRLREFLPSLGVAVEHLEEADLDAIFEDYLRHYEAAWSSYDDVLPCLSALSGFRVAVLSNGDQSQQEAKLRRTGLYDRFEAVMTSSRLGVAKPCPEAYARACERLGVSPSNAAYVGDRLDVDAEAATAAGLLGIWLDREGNGERSYDPRITSLRQVPALVG